MRSRISIMMIALASILPTFAVADSAITPDWVAATLTDHEHTIPVSQVRERWPIELRAGELLIRIRGAVVECIESASGDVRWTGESDMAGPLNLLAEREGVLYLSAKRSFDAEQPLLIRRLRIENGERLPDIAIPLDDVERQTQNRAVEAIAVDGGVILLTISGQDIFHDFERHAYRLTRIADDGAVAWSKSFPGCGHAPSPGAFLWGSMGPTIDLAAVQHLTLAGAQVLVCAGPLEDVMLIEPADGSLVWTIPRIWEYRKSFIGPSVWSYFIWRLGIDDWDWEIAAMAPEEVRAENADDDGDTIDEGYYLEVRGRVREARRQAKGETGSIVAGPIVAPFGEAGRYCVYVVTAQSDEPEWTNYLAECIVYEVGDGGKIGSMLTLPRFVRGEEFHVLEDSLFWRCDDDAMARLYVYGGGNRTIDMDWTADRRTQERVSWQQQPPPKVAVDYRDDLMLVVEEGGFMEARLAMNFRFPIALVNLLTGEKRELIVDVPFAGRIARDFHVRLDEVEFDGDDIVVTFETDEPVENPDDGAREEKVRMRLTFDAASILHE